MFWLSNKKIIFRYVLLTKGSTQLSQDGSLYICIYIYSKVPKNIACHSLNIYFVLAISEDPVEMPLYAAFHLGLHRLPKYPCKGFWSSKG